MSGAGFEPQQSGSRACAVHHYSIQPMPQLLSSSGLVPATSPVSPCEPTCTLSSISKPLLSVPFPSLPIMRFPSSLPKPYLSWRLSTSSPLSRKSSRISQSPRCTVLCSPQLPRLHLALLSPPALQCSTCVSFLLKWELCHVTMLSKGASNESASFNFTPPAHQRKKRVWRC